MNKKIIYDYVICGSGAAGLSLINELINDNFFLNHRILLLDKKKKITANSFNCKNFKGKRCKIYGK